MKKGTKLDPKTPRAMKYRLRQLMEAGNTTHQAANRLKITNKEVLALLGEMKAEKKRVNAATMPTTIDPTAFKPGNYVHATINKATGKMTITPIGPTPSAVAEITARGHATPVYRRTCEDVLALLNLETMSTESRIRLASQLISETLRRWPA